MLSLKLTLCLCALAVSSCHALPVEEVAQAGGYLNSWAGVLANGLSYLSPSSTVGQLIQTNAIQYLQLAMTRISDNLKLPTDVKTLKDQIELVKMTVSGIPQLKSASSLLSVTLGIYVDVLNGKVEDVEDIVQKRVEKELGGFLTGEEPQSVRKVKWVFSQSLVPAMKKLKGGKDNVNAVDEVFRAWYSTCVTAEKYLESKDSFKVFRTALSARPIHYPSEKEILKLASKIPRSAHDLPEYYEPVQMQEYF